MEKKFTSFGLVPKDCGTVFTFGARLAAVDRIQADDIADIFLDLIVEGEFTLGMAGQSSATDDQFSGARLF